MIKIDFPKDFRKNLEKEALSALKSELKKTLIKRLDHLKSDIAAENAEVSITVEPSKGGDFNVNIKNASPELQKRIKYALSGQ